MWDIYDRLINEIPDDLNAYVDFIHIGDTRTIVTAGQYRGVATTVNEQDRPIPELSCLRGMPLKDVARMCKSWNFIEATVGTAALNAYLSSGHNLDRLPCSEADSVFDDYKKNACGKKIAIIGHFLQLERFFSESQLYVLERKPEPGDYPDSACEYILPEADYTFITGTAFINKTLPRLLQLSRYSVILGPSTPVSSILFEYGAKEINGFIPDSDIKNKAASIGAGQLRLSEFGRKIKITAP